MNTSNPFTGHVYVKGMFHDPPGTGCHLNLTDAGVSDTKVLFELSYRSCNVKRERSVSYYYEINSLDFFIMNKIPNSRSSHRD